MALKKGDFIEIEFTGKVKDGEIFDSNIKEDLKNANLNFEPKPLIFSLGEKMFLPSIEDFLIGKPDIKNSVEYTINLPPEKAFGLRDPSLVKIISIKAFKDNNLNPVPGIIFNMDGRLAKVLSVSGGRVTIDFNNPLSGKEVIYKIKVLRKVDDQNEEVKALMDFLFKKTFDFEIKGKKIIIRTGKDFIDLISLFKDKFKSALNLELEVKEIDNVNLQNKSK